MPTFRFLLPAAALALAACTVGPDYTAPQTPDVSAFENLPPGWANANPAAADASRGDWWTVFNDSELNKLEQILAENNPELLAADARIQQARARYRGVRSGFFPTATFGPNASRSRSSTNDTAGNFSGFAGITRETYSLPVDLSWEVDLWGRIRRGLGGLEAETQSLEAARESALLSLQAELAGNWFALRAVEAEKTVLKETLGLRDENVELLRNRLEAGVATELDVVRVESERDTAAADLAALDQGRTQLGAAIATLIGQPASTFTSNPSDLSAAPPRVPVGIPSAMLERRPDIAQAERTLAASNEQIGLAYAALFPTLSLTGGGGLISSELNNLLDPSSRFWNFGAGLSAPLLNRGSLHARVDEAEAVYIENFALFRSQVLLGFQEVETSLGAIDALQRQGTALDSAVSNAQRGAELSDSRYREGLSSYLEVIDAERTRLTVKRQQVRNLNDRYQATVNLIKALGGGW